MKTLRYCKVNLRKVLTSPGFYLCVLFTLILCFTAEAYTDYTENKVYSVFGVWLVFTREEMLAHTEMSAYQMLSRSIGGWLTVFIPIIAAFPFLPLLCDERSSKNMRYSVHRLTKTSFVNGQFLTAMLTGGLAVLCGFAMFAGGVWLMFPNIVEYTPELQEVSEWWYKGTYPLFSQFGYPYLIILKFLEMFLYGAVSAVPALFMTTFLKNKYLVLCLPFFAKYLVNSIHSGLVRKMYENINNVNEVMLEIVSVMNPDGMGELFSYGDSLWKALLYHVLLISLLFLFYEIGMKRRLDFGE